MNRALDESLMRRAIEAARRGMEGGFGGPFGAVVARGDEVLAEAHNRVTHDHDPTAHAEVVAIREACAQLAHHSLAGCTLYASAEPCPMCLGSIHWARLDRLVYAASRADAAAIGFDDARFYEQLALPIGQRDVPEVQLLREESRAMMQGWLLVSPDRHY